jgi:hypothetical protein
LPTGRVWLQAEGSLPESELKNSIGSVHLDSLRRKEKGKGYLILRVSNRSEDTIIPEKSKTEKAQGLSKK